MNAAHSKPETIHALIQTAGITMRAKRRVASAADNKKWGAGSTHWKCAFALDGRRMTVEFHMGDAHRDRPTAADVLDSLASDANVDNYDSFEEWASDLGYGEDSRSAEQIYKACLKQTAALREFLQDELFQSLFEAQRL
jgi:hypothetical protein